MLKRKESQGLGLIAEEKETLQIRDVVECVCQPEIGAAVNMQRTKSAENNTIPFLEGRETFGQGGKLFSEGTFNGHALAVECCS